ncbi:MAG: transporter substrate-binding domain-containing protein [Rhizobacter sp.]
MQLGAGWFGNVMGRAARGLRAGVFACLSLAAVAAPAVADDTSFTPEEMAWVAAHPVVTFGWTAGLPPYFTFDPESPDPQGFAPEMLAQAAERAGLHVAHRRYPNLPAAYDAVRRGEVNGVAFVAAPVDKDPADLLATRPMIAANMVLAVRRDIPDISSANNFGGYRVAVSNGSSADQLLRRRFPDAKVVRHDTPELALRAVASGDADLFIGLRHVAVHFIESLLMANVQVRGTLGPGLSALGPMVSRDEPMLQAILDKALARITQRERAYLAARWLPPDIDFDDRPKASLIPAERDWVDNHGRIRVGYDTAFAPITLQTDMTEMRGLGADFVRLAAGKVGLVIESESGGTFADIYQKGIDGELDVLVGAARTSARRSHYDFVGPFLRVPTGIVTATENGLLATRLDELGRRRLALLDAHFLIPQLRTRYPSLQLVTFPTQEAVLEAVADGRADAAIGNLKVVNQLINDRYTGRVKVTGTVPDADSELYFAVRRDRPELTRLLRKGLDAVSEEEAREIERRWLVVQPESGVAVLQVLRIVGVGTAVVLWLGTWAYLLHRGNRRLRAARQIELEARQLAEATTASRGRFLGYLSHELRGTLGAIASGAAMVKAEPDAPQRDRLLGAIQSSAEGFQSLLETTLQYEQQIERPLVLQPSSVDLCSQWAQMLAPFELSARAKGLALVSSLQGADDLPRVSLDASRLRQVVNNLVGNAVKFTRQGRVSVTGRVTGPSDHPRFELVVEDTGPGLTPDDLATLFQPYAQGHAGQRLRQGAGLGLAISRQIVDAMGGRIDAECLPVGARFAVAVPLVFESAPGGAPTLATA